MPLQIPQPPTKADPSNRVWTDWYVKVANLLLTTAEVAIPLTNDSVAVNVLGDLFPHTNTVTDVYMPQDGKLVIEANMSSHSTSPSTTSIYLTFYVDGSPVTYLGPFQWQDCVGFTIVETVAAGNHTVAAEWTCDPVANGSWYRTNLIVNRSIT